MKTLRVLLYGFWVMISIAACYFLATKWMLNNEDSYRITESISYFTDHREVNAFPEFPAPSDYKSVIALDESNYAIITKYDLAFYKKIFVNEMFFGDDDVRIGFAKYVYRQNPGFYQGFDFVKTIKPVDPPVKLNFWRSYEVKILAVSTDGEISVEFTPEFNNWIGFLVFAMVFVIMIMGLNLIAEKLE
ncbi:hypothetical protein A2303_02850 [Candidatus Falkowbacteria bacterium RIFOXYB2_FULL_47_14]|uniref:Uncharacterized protein n=1 Tax=Candidatus Falkowbacteria bacterium RIFOXYA2_FULL_47_19 TaxID=1797994 RepID=A0A1F5SLM3_9BACT|nr:MAG: hypothetical protein A2227_01925 [Candidatus Falkowbacteria bacterium RIFOXYA2_FULL_47_19]OGF36255.1 MAG: hypothetical protein A2468_07595 [Candidatus Falkowbacteria bacterium RIFOXYC2_FULL_46_15]OGF43059.1 MAG: hypothetical protein A2303_02850 [Candidatus Falkowbacteria bacterium RIFOXYB2_FULL_47_14]